jgi:hypothetical protein
MMKKKIFRGAAYIILALSVPALGWGIKTNAEFTATPQALEPVVLTNAKNVAVTESGASISAAAAFDEYITALYNESGLSTAKLNYDVFRKAVTGYYNLLSSNGIAPEKQVLTIVDFSLPSTQKRLWIVDLAKKKVLFNTLVAHGQGSGLETARTFSNQANSHMSSLGFYVTSNTYIGKHGLSLRLNGMDESFNSNALNRAVVVHGAEYVSQSFINQHGRLGRSHGCPALPVELTPAIIDTIKGRTMLFINGAAEMNYTSSYLNPEMAANQFSLLQTATTI